HTRSKRDWSSDVCSSDLRVRIWSGRRSRPIASTSTTADCAALSAFSGSSAAIVEEYGKLIPIASITEDIVFAVNIPPHEPAPGQIGRASCRDRGAIAVAA